MRKIRIWDYEEIEKNPGAWEVRRLAREALRVMGYDLEPPPPLSM